MKSLGYQESVSKLIFTNVKFNIIEEDALENSTGIKFEHLYFYFQQLRVSLNYLKNFVLIKEFVSLVSATPKHSLHLIGFLDNKHLVNFRDLVIQSQRPIELIGTLSELVTKSDQITHIPSRLFSSDVVDEDTFSGFLGTQVTLSFQYAAKLKRLPKSIENVDIIKLNIRRSGVETFDGLNFSGFTSLFFIDARYSPVDPACEDEDVFKQTYGIADRVFMSCTYV
eukprot:snap_masked-scaffold_8-processed-gene-2.48-mRNA-1 protein AED:1.00 eAED:1.00 QI:0/0/0/0/1/1/3/0/224